MTSSSVSRAAQRDLDALGSAGVPPDRLAAARTACDASADPEGALAALARIAAARRERLGRPPSLDDRLLARLVPVLAASRFLAQRIAARPRLADWLAATPWFERPRPRGLLERDVRRATSRAPAGDDVALGRSLRLFKYRELLRITARDLAGAATLPDSAAELSLLAEVLIEAALQPIAADLVARHGAPAGAEDAPAAGLCVLGMGKLGSGELNYSSDVDLVLVHRGDGETAGGPGGRLSARQLHARLAERLARVLSTPMPEGFLYRVDLDLRPEGRAGAIAQPAPAVFRYYEARGRTWERAALLRARPIAGDLTLGEDLLASLAPFIHRRYLDLAAVEEIRAMKARIDREAAGGTSDLKLGPGGIREAEFVVAALQLLHAGKDARLRVHGTLAGLDRLLFAGLLSARDRDELADAWLLLRRAEHRVQMVEERQTHRLPDAPEERARLARRLGFPGAAAFEEELSRRRAGVEAIFADLLGVTGAAPRPGDPGLAAALDPSTDPAARAAALAERGFFDPVSAVAELDRLAHRAGTPFFAGASLEQEHFAHHLLEEVCRTPDPDQALRHLAGFASALLSPASYFRLLAEHPQVARLLLQLFGTSDFLARYFLRHPELLDPLIRGESSVPRRGKQNLAAELRARLGASSPDDVEQKLAGMRRFKNEEVLRVGLADVSGRLDLAGVASELTDLADVLLAACLDLALAETAARHGTPPSPAIAVIGLGKLGGRELGYHSDLDLVFLYESSQGESSGGGRGSIPAAEWHARVAQRLLSHLQVPLREGHLYKIDTRLRPSGSQGALVVSLPALASYHARTAAIWERQALLKARLVAGDAALFERASAEVLEPALYRGDDPAALAQAVAAMRARMEAEISGERGGRKNPKTGFGGLVDVEFVVQYLQLVHGLALPEVRTPATPEAILRLRDAGVLAPDDAERLADAYGFLRRLELRLRIVHDHAMSHLPHGGALATLARRLGYAGPSAGDELLADYGRVTAGVRELFRRIVGPP